MSVSFMDAFLIRACFETMRNEYYLVWQAAYYETCVSDNKQYVT